MGKWLTVAKWAPTILLLGSLAVSLVAVTTLLELTKRVAHKPPPPPKSPRQSS
jgi:hypothetical protein